jgi:hypothetical protein
MGTLLISILTLSTISFDGLTKIGGHDGVEVYLNKGNGTIEIAAVGEFDAPPAEVQAALLDYGAQVHVNKHLAESTVLSRTSNELFVYQHLKLPVIADRDFTLQVSWNRDNVRFRIDPSHGPAPSKKVIRMPLLEGQWELAATRDGNATRATYHVRIDFGGSVPRWMVSGGAAKDIPGVYIGMRTLINEHRVHGTKVSSR